MEGDSLAFRINEEANSTLIYAKIPTQEMGLQTWESFFVSMDFQEDSVSFVLGQRKWRAYYDFDRSNRHLVVDFGKSGTSTEVPPFKIKDLKISDSHKTISFPFNESRGKYIHSSHYIIRGVVENPVWTVEKSIKWTQLTERKSKNKCCIYYEPSFKTIFLFDEEGVWIFNTVVKREANCSYLNPCPISFQNSGCFISNSNLIVFETQENPNTMAKAAKFDVFDASWTQSWDTNLESSRSHHASFMNPITGKHTIFGGCGQTAFSNQFLEFDEETGTWNEIWTDMKDKIMPRYFSAAGIDPGNEYLYIFGGTGNKCGDTVVGRKYFYDLYRIRLADGEVESLWDIKLPENDIIPAKNIVVTKEYIYAACYNEYSPKSKIQLYRFSIDDGDWTKFGNEIPIDTENNDADITLYYDKNIQQLVLISNCFSENEQTRINVYSIDFPPQTTKDVGANKTLMHAAIFAGIILLIAILVICAFAVSRAKQKMRLANEYSLSKLNPDKKVFRGKTGPNSICIFGDINIRDRIGDDITATFYNQSTLLLLLLIKYGEHGLSSKRISSIFWPDKNEEKSRNSRGFAINTLRNKLKELDGVSIVFHDKHYFLEIEEPAYCDFFNFKNGLAENNDSDEIIRILSRGRFLCGMKDESLDEFKAEIEDSCLSFLENEISIRYKLGKWLDVIEIADIILLYDTTSEIAISHLVGALRNIRRYDDAKERFVEFASEMRKNTGEECPFTYKSLPLP
ncbi:MAG: hypothetical protein MJY56_02910 [Bacteroidales bacterium]|nr:hypothetical protein [Bacteroidales bacterium]